MVNGLAALGAALLLGAAAPAPSPLFRFRDAAITEASGIAVGLRSPGVVYVQNDSGDVNRFFAISSRTGATAATITVPGATNVDWEDIAVAPDAAGTPSVWLADIGDNQAARREVRVYRVPEPRVAGADRGRSISTPRAQVWRLRYPDGPTDAESLAVAPDGTAYVVTKSVLGRSTVYRLPPHPDRRRVQLLARVGAIGLVPRGVANPYGAVGELAVTGAAFSRDGSVFAVRTYAEGYAWRVVGGDVAAALRRPPTPVPLPRQPQGEGIALRGDRTALVDSEGVGSAVYAVTVPPLPAPTATSPRPAPPPPSAASRATAGRATGGGAPSAGWLIGAAAAALIVLGAAAWSWRRGRI